MSTERKISPHEVDRVCDRFAPHVRRGCDSVPSPAVLDAIHAAAGQQVRRSRILPFVRFVAAAAALLVVTLTGWLLIRANHVSERRQQAALMDDMLFLCADDVAMPEPAPAGKREDLARRLLNLQGLGALPAAEASVEQPSPLSKDPQSHNSCGLRAQRCG